MGYEWSLDPGQTSWAIYQNNTSRGTNVYGFSHYYFRWLADPNDPNNYGQVVPVVEGQRVEFSVYAGNHRSSTSEVALFFYDAAGNGLNGSSYQSNSIARDERFGGNTITGYKRIFARATAPAGAVSCLPYVSKGHTDVGVSPGDSWLFLVNPMLCIVPVGQEELTPWAPPGNYGYNLYANGQTVNQLRPAELGANVTESRTAAAITGQGAWATFTQLAPAAVVNPTFNLISDPGLRLNGKEWNLPSGWNVGQGSDVGNYAVNGTNNTNMRVGKRVAISPNAVYTFSVKNGGTGYTNSPVLQLNWYNSAGTFIDQVTLGGIAQNQGYQISQATGTAPSNAAFAECFVQSPGSFAGGGFYIVFEPKLELGSSRTVWRDDNTSGALYNNGADIDTLRPGELGANVTESRTAAAISGQGALATRNEIVPSLGNGMRFTDNLIPDNEYKDLNWWGATPNFYFQSLDNVNWSMPRAISFTSDRDFDINSQYFTLERGSTYRVRCRIWNNNTGAGWSGALWPLLHIPNQAWFSLKHGAAVNPDIADAANAIVANGDTLDQDFYFTLGNNASREVQFRFKSTARGSEVAMQFHISKMHRLGRDLINSNSNLPYNVGQIQTDQGTAAAITGQGAWATTSISTGRVSRLQDDGFIQDSTIYRPGVAALSDRWPAEANANVTETRTAAAITGQGAWATTTVPIGKITVVRPNLFPYPFAPYDGRSAAQIGWGNTSMGGGSLVTAQGFLDGSAYVFQRVSGGGAAFASPFYDISCNVNVPYSVGLSGYGGGGATFTPYMEFINGAKDTVLGFHALAYNGNSDRWEANNCLAPSGAVWLRLICAGTFPASGSYQDCVWWAIKVERGEFATAIGDSDFVRTNGSLVEYSTGATVNSLRPAEANANVTETRTAAAISGQGDLATRNSATLPFGFGNLAVNSDFVNSTFGWTAAWDGTVGGTIGRGINLPSWFGQVNVLYAWRPGTPTAGTAFDAFITDAPGGMDGYRRFAIPVLPGERLCFSWLLGTHRCSGYAVLGFYDGSGAYITEAGGSTIAENGGASNGDPNTMGRSEGFATAPANARYARVWARAIVSGGADPYLFCAQPFVTKVPTSQTVVPAYSSGPTDRAADVTAESQRSIEPQFPSIEIKQGEAGHTGNRTVTHTAKRGTATLTGGTWSLPSTNLGAGSASISSSTGTVTLSGIVQSGAYAVRYTHTDGLATDLAVNVTYIPTPASGVVSAKTGYTTSNTGVGNTSAWTNVITLTLTGCPAGILSFNTINGFAGNEISVSSGSGTCDHEARLKINGTVVANSASQNTMSGGVVSFIDFSDLFAAAHLVSSGTVTVAVELRRTNGTGTLDVMYNALDCTVIAT
jgi:hypothetical protein